MVNTDCQTTQVSASDVLAIDTLFKRIAERGHKIRTQNKSADGENPSPETLTHEQAQKSHEGQAEIRRSK